MHPTCISITISNLHLEVVKAKGASVKPKEEIISRRDLPITEETTDYSDLSQRGGDDFKLQGVRET